MMAVVRRSSLDRRSYLLGFATLALLGLTDCNKNGNSVQPPALPIVSQRPFGMHAFSYAVGTIKPNLVTQTGLDQTVTNFYDQWKAKYLRAGCGVGRYYIWTADSSGGGKASSSISVSEGHGYGMIITALMSGYDRNAKKYFDGMFQYFKDHPAGSSSNLMAWNQLADCSNSPALHSGPNYLETAYDGEFSYNACRVPWRLATDYLVSGEPRSLSAVQKINSWVKGKVGSNAALLVDGYTLAGNTSAGATGPSMSFTAPLAVAAMSDASNQAWLNSLWSQMTATALVNEDYYGNTLKLISMIVISGNWWSP